MQFSNGWLAFELGVLRRLKFSSVALPFTGEPEIGVHLKNWKVRVAANDPMLWSYTKAFALVENNNEQLDEDDLNLLLDDAYVPHEKLENPALLKWFNETDTWWFDNLRFNAERLEPYKRALALTAGMMTGDYVLSFNEQTGRAKLRRRATSHGSAVLETADSGDANNYSQRSDCDVARGVAARQR
jgi:hypothetical protein